MPELPEVEVIVRGLRGKVLNNSITSLPWLKPHVLANTTIKELKQRIINQRICEVSRRAKYIIIKLTGDVFLVVHLRMTGKLTVVQKNVKPGKHTVFIFQLDDQALVFDDMRKFGRIWLVENPDQLPQLMKLGPDALNLTYSEFKKICVGKKPIKSLILDQVKIAGLGNIYASEILYLAHVHPQKPAGNLTAQEIKNIHNQIKPVLRQAIKAGGTSISDYVNSSGVPGEFQKLLKVYQRENQPCYTCNTPIQRIMIANRSTFFCPLCQKSKA